jgi:succinate-semialdehyde dehydrogenase/glutarate-semialdehyde dehydrogenase
MYSDLALFIDGAFLSVDGRGGEPVVNPVTGQPLATLPHASAADLDRALEAAKRAFPSWRRTSAYDRSRILERAADLIRERKSSIARILTLEEGKPLAESESEVAYSADVIEWCAEEGRRAYGRIIPSRTPGLRHTVLPEPIGPCAAFTPWNFPALTPARKIGGALAAGCTLILKPAEETPGTAVEIARAFSDAGLPAGVLNIVFGKPAEVSSHLIASPIIRKISFTGSTVVGRHLMHLAADGMKRTTMELGGHAPVLIFDDVDVEATVRTAAAGKYRNAGQVCISPTRFFVQERIYPAFVDAFVDAAKNIKVGDGLESGVTMGPLANPRRVEAMERIVADARQRGGKVLAGGSRRGNAGFFFDPTAITDIPDDCLLMTEEPFGPVAPIVPFKTLDEALARANALPYGLAAYAFTTSAKTALAVSEGLESGMVGINGFGVSNPETPFGGVKDSGHGYEGGLEGLQAYFNMKLVSQA